MAALDPFHLAIPVTDLDAARDFYIHVLGCVEGRSDSRWVDFNFHGHQLVCHLDTSRSVSSIENPVDGHRVPVPHFGVVVDMPTWRRIADELKRAGVEFILEPYIRFAGEAGEQATLFIRDPSGNAIEIKGFVDIDQQLFSTTPAG